MKTEIMQALNLNTITTAPVGVAETLINICGGSFDRAFDMVQQAYEVSENEELDAALEKLAQGFATYYTWYYGFTNKQQIAGIKKRFTLLASMG